MADTPIVVAADLERIERGDDVATADAVGFLERRVQQLEDELRSLKTRGYAAMPATGAETVDGGVGQFSSVWYVINPRTGKIALELGELGFLNADNGKDHQSHSGIIFSPQLGGTTPFAGAAGEWFVSSGQDANVSQPQLAFFCKRNPSFHGSTAMDHVVNLGRFISGPATHEGEYYFGPSITDDPQVSLGTAGAPWTSIFTKFLILGANGRFVDADHTTYTYASGNFTGGGSQTWTVDDADEVIHYQRFGSRLHIVGHIAGTDVGGTPDAALRLTLPLSMTGAAGPTQISPIVLVDAGAATAVGFAQLLPSNTYVSFHKIDASNWTGTAADNTSIWFNLSLEVT